MMTKEKSTKIVNFMTLEVGVLVLGRDHIRHVVKCVISSSRQEDSKGKVKIMYNFENIIQYLAHWLLLQLGILMQYVL